MPRLVCAQPSVCMIQPPLPAQPIPSPPYPPDTFLTPPPTSPAYRPEPPAPTSPSTSKVGGGGATSCDICPLILFTISCLHHGCRSRRPNLGMSLDSSFGLHFATIIPFLRHEQVQDRARYATGPPGDQAPCPYYAVGSKSDIPQNLTQQGTSGERGSMSFPSAFSHPPWTVVAKLVCGSAQ